MALTAILSRGDRLEYLVAGVFQGQGYLVRRRIPLIYGSSGQDATDIDILGIKFTSPFQLHYIICDCKDRQRSKPYERIFWTKGLASFIRASDAYVCLPKASWEIIDFARSGQVRVLTNEVLQDSFIKIYGKDGRALGLADYLFYEPLYQRLSKIAKKDKKANDILSQSRTLYLIKDPYISLNIALASLKIAVKELAISGKSSPDLFELWKFISADLTVVTSMLILSIASDTMGFPKSERERHIIDKLTYGDISPVKAKEIFSLAKSLALETVKTLSPDYCQQTLLPFDIGKIEPPSYSQNVVGLVERAISSPFLYYELPQLLDYLLFERSLQNKGFSDDEYRKTFSSTKMDERLKVARNIFVFIRDSVGFDLKVFWPMEENHLPKKSSSQDLQ